MFRYLDSEIAELQQHTSYFFHREKGQWCQIDRQGAMHFISTGVLLHTMVQNLEYPVLIFYDRMPAASNKVPGSVGENSLGGAVDAFPYTSSKAVPSEAFGEMKFDGGLNTADFASSRTRFSTSPATDGHTATVRRGRHPDKSAGGRNHDRENCSGSGSCATM